MSLLPGMMFWLNSAYLKNIKNVFLKFFSLPFLIIIISFSAFYLFNNISSLLGVYGDVDSAIQQAQIIQSDLLREEQYGGNNYNIGQLDGSVMGLLSVAPIAILTALFRPFIWEIGSPTMILSAFENTILIIFTAITLLQNNPLNFIRIIIKNPFLLYCLIFSLLFSFGVGIAGTNFGALVRYKIPLMPFFFSMLYITLKIKKYHRNS